MTGPAAGSALPALPGTSAILGLPLVFLAAQLAFGRRPWLQRVIPRPAFRALVARMHPWLQRAERLLRPRAGALALPPMEYLVGALCLVLAVVVLLLIAMGNMLPAFSISLLALGILERDGYWILAGLAAALASAALVSGVVIVFVKMALYAVAVWLPWASPSTCGTGLPAAVALAEVFGRAQDAQGHLARHPDLFHEQQGGMDAVARA